MERGDGQHDPRPPTGSPRPTICATLGLMGTREPEPHSHLDPDGSDARHRPTTAASSEAGVSGVDVLLADGSTAHLRPLVRDDAPAVARLFSGLSRDSMVMRFFGPHRVSDAEIDRLLRFDGVDEAALAVFRSGELIALAEYDRQPGSIDAEVAFVVADEYQGRGLGTLLLEHLADLARRSGIGRFVVDTLAVNAKMLGVLRRAGFARQYHRDSSVTRVVLDIAPTAEAREAADERDRTATRRSIERLLRPRSIAVIGASRQPGTVGHELLRNLVAGGFTGPVYPVNPEAVSVASLPAWPTIESIPGPVDVAVIAVPADAVQAVAESCGRAGVGGLVVISAGFAETGAAGSAAQAMLTRTAHHYGMRLIGPNCFGMVNVDPAISMNATFATYVPSSGRIGFASQSGGLGIAILAEAAQRGLGLSAFVSMGNKADVSSNDLLTWWEADPGTDVVLLYIESFGNPPKFNRLARRFGRTKPIVAVKSGRSGAGSRAASSHTAAVANSDRAVDALLEQTGVIRVDTVEELFDVGAVLAHQPVPKGPRVGIIGNAGGPGVLAADAVTGYGLCAPELSADLQHQLRAFLAPEAGVGNPVDMVATAGAESYRRALDLLLASGEVDAVIAIFTPPLVTRAHDVAEAVVAAVDTAADRGTDVAVVAAFLGAADARLWLQQAARPVPCFTYPESAARALAHAVRYGRWRSQPPSPVRDLPDVEPNRARRLLDAAWEQAPTPGRTLPGPIAPSATIPGPTVPGATTSVTGEAALDILRCFGIPVAGSLSGTVSAPPAPLSDNRTSPPVETVARLVRDPTFGPLVTFGSGGRLAELLDDSAIRVTPLTEADARHLVLSRPTSSLLIGSPDEPAASVEPQPPLESTVGIERLVHVDQLVDIVLRLGRLGEDLPEIASVELSPIVCDRAGTRVHQACIKVTAAPAALLADRPRQLR